MVNNFEIIFRLLLATILGGVVGLERETEDKPAGLRTHILVCVGSTLIMLISIYIYDSLKLPPQQRADPARIAAQVVVGIGFLGAGTIMRFGSSVRGLTTAATIWTVSGIGLALGCGFYIGAVFTTLIVLVVLFIFERAEKVFIKKKRFKIIKIDTKDVPGQLGKIGSILGNENVNIKAIELKQKEKGLASIELWLEIPPQIIIDEIIEKLKKIEGVCSVKF
jgi:putative Mg2+ transporter-C (MgtC) family protein